MFGNLGEMASMIKKAKDIQKNIEAMKEALANSEFRASAGGDAVVVTVSGDFQVRTLVIAEDARGRNDLDALTLDAVNAALSCARSAMQEKMREAAGGLNIPGLF